LFYGRGLTFNIISMLSLLLVLAMLMTVFVMDIFWQRDLVRSYAVRAEEVHSLLLQDEGLTHHLLAWDNNGKALLGFLKKTGAHGGVLLDSGSAMHSIGGIISYKGKLQELAKQALLAHRSHRFLAGVSWNVIVPAKKYLLIAQPLSLQGLSNGAIALLYPLEPVYASMRRSQQAVFGYLLVNFIVLFVIGLFRFHRIAVRPVEELVLMTDAYEEDGAIPFLSLENGNSFGQLSSALNRMLQRIEEDKKKLLQSVTSLEEVNKELVASREEIVRAEKLASVGRLAAGLAHEIGNPIGVVQGYLGLLQQDDLIESERNDYARRSEKELQRINGLIRQLLDFARADSGRQENVSMNSLLQGLVEMVSCQPFMDGVQVSVDLTASRDNVRGDGDKLQQVFLNCLFNAADAIASLARKKGKIDIKTKLVHAESSKQASIEILIADNGAGIAKEDCANIFDPFFTTKEPGKGTGLGLSVAYSIVEGHGGGMRVESLRGKGTMFFVVLPLVHGKRDGGKEGLSDE